MSGVIELFYRGFDLNREGFMGGLNCGLYIWIVIQNILDAWFPWK